MWGESTGVENRGETTRGKQLGGKRLGGETSCYRFGRGSFRPVTSRFGTQSCRPWVVPANFDGSGAGQLVLLPTRTLVFLSFSRY